MAGGLLIVVAAGLAWWSLDPGDEAAKTPLVVAAADLAPGQVVGADDLTLVALALDAEIRRHAFTSIDAVAGGVVVAPRSAGQLLQTGDLAPATSSRGGQPLVEISFPVARSRAPVALQPGERVTVVATHGPAGDPVTSVSAEAVLVVSYRVPDHGFAAADEGVLTVALESRHDPVQVVHDTQVAQLTVIRTNRPPGSRDE